MFIQRFSIFLFICLWSLSLIAQDKVNYQYLYLKDGSFLKGNLVEERTTIMKWQLTNGDIVPIAMTHVDHIQKAKQNWVVFPDGKITPEKGNYHIFTTGVLAGKGGEFQENPIGANLFHFIKGVKFNQFLAVGIGTGLDVYDHEFVPVYLDIRGDILNQSITPYYALNAGYGFSFDMSGTRSDLNYKGGMLVHPALGIRFSSRKRVAYLLEVGYKFQHGKIEYKNREITDKLTYRRLSLKAGIAF